MINQCDGCARGLPIDESGLHKGIGWDVIACTKHLYAEDEMNNQQIEQYRKILADKPEGVTHYTECVNDKAPTKQEFNRSHLLSDIKTIVDQYDENQLLKARVDELESLVLASRCPCCDGSGAYYDHNEEVAQCQWCDETKELREKHNIEQQIKGVERLLDCRELNLSEGDVHTFMDKCNKLRQQAKEQE